MRRKGYPSNDSKVPAIVGDMFAPMRVIIQFRTIDIQDIPLKTSMSNPKTMVLVFGSDNFPVQLVDFQVPALSFGVYPITS